MDLMIVLAVLVSLISHPLLISAHWTKPRSRIMIVGAVFCDICSNNTLSRNSYFLSGVEVQIQCKLMANSATTSEEIKFSVNRTTGKHGVYHLEVPSVDGVDCAGGYTVQTLCQAALIGSSSSPACNVPAMKTTTSAVSVKSKQENVCIFNLNALSYRPSKRNSTICGDQSQEFPNDFDSAKFFLPCFPPFPFPWPSLPPLPRLPPLPKLPFPFSPFETPPSLPFPFPPSPPVSLPLPPPPPAFNWRDPKTWIPQPPPLSPPPPPPFNWGDPKTWAPYVPFLNPPPPPAFNWGDPKTWAPYIPSLNPPPPPAFNWGDPRTWFPSPPASPQSQSQHP